MTNSTENAVKTIVTPEQLVNELNAELRRRGVPDTIWFETPVHRVIPQDSEQSNWRSFGYRISGPQQPEYTREVEEVTQWALGQFNLAPEPKGPTLARDLDLVRAILFKIEESPLSPVSGSEYQPFEVSGYDPMLVYYHLEMLREAGWLHMEVAMGSPPLVWITAITWEGHDFIETVRNAGVWARVRSKISTEGGGMAIAAVKALAHQYLHTHLGIP
jgi:hypothetical protein